MASGTSARLTSLTTPPKSTLPVRSQSVLSRTSISLPGIARHMRFLPFDGGGHNLAQGNPAVTRRNTLVPVWRKTLLCQAIHGTLQQAAIEQSTAAKDDTSLTTSPAHLEDCLDQARVKPARD